MPQRILASPNQARLYSVFLSSGSDAAELRDRVDQLFMTANDVLVTNRSTMRIEVRRWEQYAPQRVAPQSEVNDLFVAAAVESHMTVALILDDIRAGTLQELEAVLERTDRPLALVIFSDPAKRPKKELRDFKARWGTRLLYLDAGPAGGERSWFQVVRVLVDFIILMIATEVNEQREVFYEIR